jgi:signal transduction histidine kinase
MLKPIFRRQFLLTAIIFICALTAANFLSRELILRERVDILQHHGELYLYTLANSGKNPLEISKDLNSLKEKAGAPFRFDLIQNGISLISGETYTPRPQFLRGPQPERIFEVPGHPGLQAVVRMGPPPKDFGHFYMTASIFLAIILASFLSVFLLLRRFRGKAELAKSVLERMQQGDLKARFPLSKWDDAGHILRLFNEMADEIERLVEKLRTDEKTRLHLLQDIAHDLRTPISSLKTSIEGLHMDERMDPQNRKELTDLAFQETEYLTRLVEDLLFLALVIEPKYKVDAGEIEVGTLIQNLLPQASAAYPAVKVNFNSLNSGRITGSAHLLTRLVRNALANALSHAQTKVEVTLCSQGANVEIKISDDGPGFSPEALANFGQKRSTRYLSPSEGSRISVGLGSVIMSAIAVAHDGSIRAGNLTAADGKILGAVLTITLPGSIQLALAQ